MAEAQPAIVCLTASGLPVARRAAEVLGGELHSRSGRVEGAMPFGDTAEHLRALFASGRTIIGVCASGILIRILAPMLGDKRAEPPVLALAEDGSSVVPLLGGHHGANALARRLASALEAHAAVTTASDLALGVALDEPPAGWRLVDPAKTGPVTAALLAGRPACCHGTAEFLVPLSTLPDVTRDNTASQNMATAGVAVLGADGTPDPDLSLTYEPTQFALGVGCARNCPAEELAGLAEAALAEAGLHPASIAGVFSLDLKADEPAVLALADRLGIPARFFDARTLEEETPRLANPSEIVFAEVGCHGVAEAAALAATGPDGRLIVEKQKSTNATVAIARAPAPITAPTGRKRGRVALVGIGPGQSAWRTPEASRLIAEADELVGYGFYIDLLGPLAAQKPRRDFPLGGETDRCRYALEEAARGRDIALICSGDAGIYAMGALVWELIADEAVSDAARRVEVVSAPGISALQAAAARAGAPLGHDFCAISLSDLLTPRKDILRRVEAAAAGDFVTALYNPVSQRRRELFVKTMEILSGHRPSETPVVLASNLGRSGECVRILPLKAVSVDDVDMMTVVIVGSSQSRWTTTGDGARVFTPRGYSRKRATPGG